MNLMAVAPTWLILILCVTLAAAAVEDAIRLRISNVIVIVVVAEAIIAMLAHGLTFAIWENFVLFVGFLITGTVLFSAGMLGGGDVKLLAAVALWVDLEHALALVAAVFITGGLLAVLMLSSRLLFRRSNGVALRERSRQIPYAVAIAAGSLFLLAFQQEFAFPKHPNPLEFHSLEKPSGPHR